MLLLLVDDVGEASSSRDLYRQVGKVMSGGSLGELMRVRKKVSLEDSKIIRDVGFFTDGMQYVGECTRGVVWVNKNGVDSLYN